MLAFSSGNTRSVNAERAVLEALELAAVAGHGPPSLVLLYAGFGHDLRRLTAALRAEHPTALVLAVTCAGVVGRDGPGESMHDIALMGLHGEGCSVSQVEGVHGSNSYAKGVELARGLREAPLPVRMVYVLACANAIANDRLIAGIESVLGTGVVIFGASTTDPIKGAASVQAINGRVLQQSAVAVGIWDPSLEAQVHVSHGYVAAGEPVRVTRGRENLILELDGVAAWPLYLSRLGLQPGAGVADTFAIGALAARLPSALARGYGNSHILRAVTDHSPTGVLTCTTTCREGQWLWFTVRDEAHIFSDLERMLGQMARALSGCTPVAIFHSDCLARGRRLFQRVTKEELVHRMQHPFLTDSGVPPWLGIYGAGEYAPLGGRNRLHNYTTALTALYRRNVAVECSERLRNAQETSAAPPESHPAE